MTDRRVFAAQVGPDAAVVRNQTVPVANPFFKMGGWSRTVEHLRDRLEVNPITQYAALPNTWEFELPQMGDMAISQYLKINVGAITGIGAAATYTRLVDGAGIAIFPNIKLYGSQDRQYTVTSSYFHYYHVKHLHEWERKEEAARVGLNLTPAQRNTRALAAQEFLVPIRHHWEKDKADAPLLLALSEKLRIRCESANYADVIETDDATSSPTFTVSCTIVQDFITVHDSVRKQLIAAVAEQRRLGRLCKIPYTQSVPRATILSAATESTIELKNISLSAEALVVRIKRQSDYTNWAKKPFVIEDSLLDNLEFELNASGTQIMDRRPVRREIVMHHRERWVGGEAPPLFVILFKERPLHCNHESGFLTFASLQNPVLKLYKSTGTFGADLYVEIEAICINFFNESGSRVHTLFG